MLGVLELVHARREDRVDHGRVRERDEPKRPLRVQLDPVDRPEPLEVPPKPLLRRHLGQFGRILCVLTSVLTSVLKSVLNSVLSFLVTSHPGV